MVIYPSSWVLYSVSFTARRLVQTINRSILLLYSSPVLYLYLALILALTEYSSQTSRSTTPAHQLFHCNHAVVLNSRMSHQLPCHRRPQPSRRGTDQTSKHGPTSAVCSMQPSPPGFSQFVQQQRRPESNKERLTMLLFSGQRSAKFRTKQCAPYTTA